MSDPYQSPMLLADAMAREGTNVLRVGRAASPALQDIVSNPDIMDNVQQQLNQLYLDSYDFWQYGPRRYEVDIQRHGNGNLVLESVTQLTQQVANSLYDTWQRLRRDPHFTYFSEEWPFLRKPWAVGAVRMYERLGPGFRRRRYRDDLDEIYFGPGY